MNTRETGKIVAEKDNKNITILDWERVDNAIVTDDVPPQIIYRGEK